jgi:hypothetical protein
MIFLLFECRFVFILLAALRFNMGSRFYQLKPIKLGCEVCFWTHLIYETSGTSQDLFQVFGIDLKGNISNEVRQSIIEDVR